MHNTLSEKGYGVMDLQDYLMKQKIIPLVKNLDVYKIEIIYL